MICTSVSYSLCTYTVQSSCLCFIPVTQCHVRSTLYTPSTHLVHKVYTFIKCTLCELVAVLLRPLPLPLPLPHGNLSGVELSRWRPAPLISRSERRASKRPLSSQSQFVDVRRCSFTSSSSSSLSSSSSSFVRSFIRSFVRLFVVAKAI